MYDFILQTIVFLSLGAVIYLLARALPRITNESEAAVPIKPTYLDRLLNRIPLQKIDEAINGFIAKILRKTKVVVMKIDNFIHDNLNKLSKNNVTNKSNLNLDDIAGQVSKGDSEIKKDSSL